MAGPRLHRDGAGNPMSPGQHNARAGQVPKVGRVVVSMKHISKAQEKRQERKSHYITTRMNMRGIHDINAVAGEHNNWRGRHVKPGAGTVIKRHGIKLASIAGYDVYSMYEPLKRAVVEKQLAPHVRGAFLGALRKHANYYLTIKVSAPAA